MGLQDLISNECVTSAHQPMPDWLREAWAFYYETGGWRASDIYRMFGDQSTRVSIGPGQRVTIESASESKQI